jgi:hypothetical protein
MKLDVAVQTGKVMASPWPRSATMWKELFERFSPTTVLITLFSYCLLLIANKYFKHVLEEPAMAYVTYMAIGVLGVLLALSQHEQNRRIRALENLLRDRKTGKSTATGVA